MIRGLPEELHGRRVTLRPLQPSDYEAWREVRRRCGEWLTKWEPRPGPGTPDVVEDPKAFAARCAARDRERQLGTGYGFGVFVDSRFVGEVNLNSVQRGAFQNAYVGYWIDQAAAGNGYTPEAVVVSFRFAFEEAGLHRLQVAVVPRNHASKRVANKLWLRDEGTAVRYLEINGRWEDHVRFAITAEEWVERRDEYLETWISR